MERWILSASSALLVALALLAPSAALAQKKGSDEQKARELYKQGQTAYDLGEFDKALALYSDAYKLKALPGFLFNIAQCHRQKGAFRDAAFFFGRFLDNTNPTAANVELARELLEDMKRRQDDADRKAEEARLAEEKRKADEAAKKDAPLATQLLPELAVAPPPPPPPVEPETPLYKKGWFWGVVGGAVVAVGAGTAAIILTRPKPTWPVSNLSNIDGR